MKTLSIKAKLINCFFALTLVTGLCVPSIASYAYAEPKGEAQNTVAVGESDNRVADFNENDSNELRGSSSSQSSQPVEDQTNKQNELESNSQTQVTTLAEESVATTQSASLAVETRGMSSTAQVATAIGETVNGQDGYISMVGPYEFNATGNTNVRGKYTNTVGQALHSKHVGDLVKKSASADADKAVSGYSLDPMQVGNKTYYVGGKTTGGNGADGYPALGNNSSSAQLAPCNTNGNSKIVKAYLVVACTQSTVFQGSLTPLSKYGVSFIAPNTDKIYRLYPEVVYKDGATASRYSCFFDVTDIVKKQPNGGYGWYSVLNIPCTSMSDALAPNTAGTGTDYFASWRLAVVEENTELDPRMLRLKLGGVPVAKNGEARVSIEGDGLSVKADPTGQLIASMDGTDCDGSNTQNITYTTTANTGTSTAKIITNSATGRANSNKYFRLRIDNRDLLNDATSFDPAPINANASSYSYIGSSNERVHNTDLVVQDINDKHGGMELKGGENKVNMTVSTSDAPTILSVLGLTLDIVAPKFETTLKIANLNQHYATTDADYKKDSNNHYIQTAQEGDQLRAVMVCQNVSEAEKTIGLKNPYVTFKVNSFKTIDENSIQGYFKPGYASDQNQGALDNPDTIALSKVEVKYDETEQCYLITCKPDKDNEHITKRGYFEVSFTGEARSSKEYIEYTDEASVEGEFVDEAGKPHDDFHMARLGLTKTTTASDKEKYPLTVTAVGPGKVAGTARYYDGDIARISWEANENAHVVAVFEDSSVRDDLVAASQNNSGEIKTQADTGVGTADLANTTDVTMTNKGKEIVVVFESDPEDPDNPDNPQEEDTQEGTYSVKTIADGGVENISDSGTIDADSDYAVNWSVKPGYRVTSIQVDGVAIPFDETTKSIDFSKISANHVVKILTEKVASDGSDGTWIVSTSISGPGTISATKAVKAGDSYKVTWAKRDPRSDAQLSLVKVDGKVVYDEYLNNIKTDTENNAQSTKVEHEFTNIDTNHSVEVVYRGSTNTYSKDYVIDTKITGGLGDITPTVTVPEDNKSNVDITVTPRESSKVTALYLGRGSVKQLLEDGKDGVKITKNADTGAWTVTLPASLIDSDYTVEAVMNGTSSDNPGGNPGDNPGGNQDKQYQITTSIAGGSGGKITASQINIAQGDSRTVSWQSDENNEVSAVMVDGNMRDDLLNASKIDFANINADHSVVVYISKKNTSDPGDNPGGDNPGNNPGGDKPVNPDNPNGHDPNKPDPSNPENPGTPGNPGGIPHEEGDENYVYVNVVTIGAGEASASVAAPLKGSAAVTWKADKNHEVASITVDGIKRIDLMKMAQQGSLSFENLMRNHSVVITFGATSPGGSDNPGSNPGDNPGDNPGGSTDPTDPRDNIDVTKPETYSLITTKILGGAGTITGNTYNPAGATPIITWQPQEGYYVKNVFVDGKEIPLTEGMSEYKFDALEAGKHHSVEVRMAPVEPVNPDNPSNPDDPQKIVVIDDEIDFPPMPGGKVTPDDIIDVIEKTYGDDPNFPQGTPEVKITKDGQPVSVIDQSVPGVYVIEVTYTDDAGNQKAIRLTYTVKDSLIASENNGAATDKTGNQKNKVNMSESAHTADSSTNALIPISCLAMGSLALMVYTRRKKNRKS